MPLPINPYIAGNPVGSTNAFIGRDDVLRDVLRVLRNPNQNAITLFGQRRIGKTSVLENLVEQLPKEGNFHPVYFDLQDKAAWTVQKVLSILARTIAESLGIDALSNEDDIRYDFKETWLPNALAQLPENTSLVLLFDEFDVLADPKATQAITRFFPYLRELLFLNPDHLQFIFVLGRNLSDLNQIALSLFKGVPDKRVSLLSQKDTEKLTLLSEENNTLTWTEDALKRVWAVTSGHPFLTQALASQIWENAYEDEPESIPEIFPEMVDTAISATLESSRNTLRWLWDGLGSAERVVASALAQAGDRIVTATDLERILRESGVRILIRELQNAPQLLQDWDILEEVEEGYKFRVELLRRWIIEHKPLSRVQEELDYIQPVAENMFQAARGLYRNGDLQAAENQLQQALGLNPSHVRANELLAEILISQNELEKARDLLENLLDIAPSAARPRLIQIYLMQAKDAEKEEEQLELFEKVLTLEPENTDALISKRAIYKKHGVARIKKLEEQKQFRKALETAQKMASIFPEEEQWEDTIQRLSENENLAKSYQRALGALHEGDNETAIFLLIRILQKDPHYEKAAEQLHLAVNNENIEDLREENKKLQNDVAKLQKKTVVLSQELAISENENANIEKEQKTNPNWQNIFGILGVFAMVVIIYSGLTFIQRNKLTSEKVDDAPISTVQSDNNSSEEGSLWTRPADRAIMSYIPAGEFIMGSAEGNPDEYPVRETYLDAFWIDQNEVTNAMYALCIEAGSCNPLNNTGFFDDELYAQYPVVYVSWKDAQNYCAWADSTLPTEAQWEKAARGGLEDKIYPWGDEDPTCTPKANNGAQYDACGAQLVAVKTFAQNDYKLYDMAGNVWEWTADWYKDDYYQSTPTGDSSDLKSNAIRIARGGSWLSDTFALRVANRYGYEPDATFSNIGFRCARNIP